MALLDEFQDYPTRRPDEAAKRMLFAVMHDLLGRRGFRQTWDGIDDDIREEILETNLVNISLNTT